MKSFTLPDVSDGDNIHATCVEVLGVGVLLVGKSASGKSDLALRLINDAGHQNKLVSDDQVILKTENGTLTAHAPKPLEGLLEVRGVGICSFDFIPSATVKLLVLLDPQQTSERLPDFSSQQREIAGINIPYITLNAFEASACLKIQQAVKLIGDRGLH